MRVTQIAPCNFFYEDAEAAVEFLTEAFGFEEQLRDRRGGRAPRRAASRRRPGDARAGDLEYANPRKLGQRHGHGARVRRRRRGLRAPARQAQIVNELVERRTATGAATSAIPSYMVLRPGSGLDAHRTDGRRPGGPSLGRVARARRGLRAARLEALFRSDHYLSQTDPDRVATDAWDSSSAPPRGAHVDAPARDARLACHFPPSGGQAKAAATADQISGGRIEVGMGAGWMAEEHERFGFDFPETKERVRTLAQHVEQVDRLLRKTRSLSSSLVLRPGSWVAARAATWLTPLRGLRTSTTPSAPTRPRLRSGSRFPTRLRAALAATRRPCASHR